MFSGIVEEKGKVKEVAQKENLMVLTVAADQVTEETKIGDSISVDGVCLTVTQKEGRTLTFDIMKETLRATTLGLAQDGREINLERALKVSDRIGGHFVSGHIDGMGTVRKRVDLENYVEYQIDLSEDLMRYIAPKGSVCIDGISLTIGDVKQDHFSVYLIPHTLDVTTIGSKKEGDQVNIETDILAKYILNENKLSMNA